MCLFFKLPSLERGWEEDDEGKGGQINGDGRRLGFRWSAHDAIYRRCLIELYT